MMSVTRRRSVCQQVIIYQGLYRSRMKKHDIRIIDIYNDIDENAKFIQNRGQYPKDALCKCENFYEKC